MDVSASEWNSGCESGWTVYLDESVRSPNQYHRSYRSNYEDEEDLSMLSDASSGPPHFNCEIEEEGVIRFSSKSSKKNKGKEIRGKSQHSCLDDTASSSSSWGNMRCVDSSKNKPSIGHGDVQGNAAFGAHFGFWPSSHSQRKNQPERGLFRGRRS